MSPVAATCALKAFSVATTALAFKMMFTLATQGFKSLNVRALTLQGSSSRQYGALPENARLLNSDPQQEYSMELLNAQEIEYRWKRIVQNDLENIPISLVVMLVSVLVGGHEATNVVLITVFAAARIGHTYAYANEMRLRRSYFWGIGQVCALAGGLNGVLSFIIG
jgi:uncharacterized MAPEG superfamily protein